MSDSLKNQVIAHIDEQREALEVVMERMYHEPEIGYQEHQASQWLCHLLEQAGYEVHRGIEELDTAFVGYMPGLEPGPRIAILAEYDALPGIGHGCGHNLIAASSIGAALGLAPLMRQLAGEVIIVGSPAEEGAVDDAGGKIALLEKGIFKDVTAAMMVHPSTRTSLGGVSNARVALEMTFHGRTAHAAGAPHEGINALDAAIQTYNSWNALRQHVKPDVRIHGIITEGGQAPNVVPDLSQIRLYVRAQDARYLKEVEEKVRLCAEGAAMATGARVEFRYTARPYDNMLNNQPLGQIFADNLSHLGLQVEPSQGASAGSTDMGNVSQAVPSIHPYVAIAPTHVNGHSREFGAATLSEQGRKAMLNAAKGLAMTTLDLLTNPDLVTQVQMAFAAQTET